MKNGIDSQVDGSKAVTSIDIVPIDLYDRKAELLTDSDAGKSEAWPVVSLSGVTPGELFALQDRVALLPEWATRNRLLWVFVTFMAPLVSGVRLTTETWRPYLKRILALVSIALAATPRAEQCSSLPQLREPEDLYVHICPSES